MSHVTRVGIDEAGRGPLAGPVAVGVFAALPGFDLAYLHGIRDSKTLTYAAREHWYSVLTTLPTCLWAVSLTSAAYIDKYGINPAVRRAMAAALTKLALDPRTVEVLLDGGLRAPAPYLQQQTIVHGDATEPLIAAGAILAKVTRDRYIERMDERFPEYGFAQHKGYGTKAHREAILMHGLCELHRASFCKAFSQNY